MRVIRELVTRPSIFAVALIALASTVALGQEQAKPLVESSGVCASGEAMMRTKLLAEIEASKAQWIESYNKLKTREDVEARQSRMRESFRAALGPMWDHNAPLNVQVTGKTTREKFRVENIIFESVPGVYVTGALMLPLEERFKPPYPAMLIVCGHTSNGKAYELYQGLGILAAVNGLAAFVMDPIDQGERFQYLNKEGNPVTQSVPAHNLVQAGSILVGRNTATFEVWDGMRAIDFLQSRSDIQGDKIGVCGTSGGGTQSSYIMNLDDRIALGAPSCYICNIFDDLTHNLGPQDGEQNIFGQLAFGMDHADYLFMRAPMPTLMACATKDFFNCDDGWESYRYAVRIFSRLGYANRITIVEKDDEHGYSDIARVGTVRWALLWFAGRNDEITEHDQPLLTNDEILSIKSGKSVMSLPGAKTSRDLNVELARELEPGRRAKWLDISADAASQLVRGRAILRAESELPAAKEVATADAEGGRDVVYETDEKIFLTSRENFGADEKFDEMTIVISDKSRATDVCKASLASGGKVAAIELRGYGDTQAIGRTYYSHSQFGTDGSDNCLAYLLGKTYVGMRCDDLLAMANYYRATHGVKKIRLVAEGYAGTIGLIATIASPSAFESVKLEGDLPTWMEQLQREYGPIPLTNTIHGVLNDFDIDDLTSYLDRIGKLAK